MARLNRSRVISVRLSDEEFGQLRTLCEARGIENLSEIARSAMRRLVAQSAEQPKPEMDARVTELLARMGVLDREIDRISGVIGLARLG